VVKSDAGRPSSASHHGACGHPSTVGYERCAAFGRRVGHEPLACACDKLLVPCVGLVERAQSHRDCGRLAGRRAPVRLERLTKSAVGVAEGGDRVANRSSVSTREEPLEATTVEDPGVAGEKPGGSVDVGSRHRRAS
jgi:hypothetical protein